MTADEMFNLGRTVLVAAAIKYDTVNLDIRHIS